LDKHKLFGFERVKIVLSGIKIVVLEIAAGFIINCVWQFLAKGLLFLKLYKWSRLVLLPIQRMDLTNSNNLDIRLLSIDLSKKWI
jgi:hypothetical protein